MSSSFFCLSPTHYFSISITQRYFLFCLYLKRLASFDATLNDIRHSIERVLSIRVIYFLSLSLSLDTYTHKIFRRWRKKAKINDKDKHRNELSAVHRHYSYSLVNITGDGTICSIHANLILYLFSYNWKYIYTVRRKQNQYASPAGTLSKYLTKNIQKERKRTYLEELNSYKTTRNLDRNWIDQTDALKSRPPI